MGNVEIFDWDLPTKKIEEKHENNKRRTTSAIEREEIFHFYKRYFDGIKSYG